jgi:hypothetical protein
MQMVVFCCFFLFPLLFCIQVKLISSPQATLLYPKSSTPHHPLALQIFNASMFQDSTLVGCWLVGCPVPVENVVHGVRSLLDGGWEERRVDFGYGLVRVLPCVVLRVWPNAVPQGLGAALGCSLWLACQVLEPVGGGGGQGQARAWRRLRPWPGVAATLRWWVRHRSSGVGAVGLGAVAVESGVSRVVPEEGMVCTMGPVIEGAKLPTQHSWLNTTLGQRKIE